MCKEKNSLEKDQIIIKFFNFNLKFIERNINILRNILNFSKEV
jgi:hypothetical protein